MNWMVRMADYWCGGETTGVETSAGGGFLFSENPVDTCSAGHNPTSVPKLKKASVLGSDPA